jgi:hypothetical protein
MINFLAYGREFRLRDGRVITVKRLAMGFYYLLIASVLIYKTALEKTSGIKSKKNIKDYIKFMRENALDFAKVKVEWTNIIGYLKDWVDGADVAKLEHGEVLECLSHVIEFNTVKAVKGGKGIASLDELNEQFEQMVSLLCLTLKKEPEYITHHITNFQASVLVAEYNRMRVSQMNDLRFAYNANKQEYAKYTGLLMGEKVVSGEDIINNPNLLNEVH